MQQPQQAPKKKKIRVPRVVNGVETMVEIEVDDVSGPEWGANDKHTLLNHSLRRVDGPLKVTGAAHYTYDRTAPGMLHGRLLRSPHAHASVLKVDTSAARRIPGVKAIVGATNEDVVEGSNKAADEAEKRDNTELGGARTPERKERIVRFAGEQWLRSLPSHPKLPRTRFALIKVEYKVSSTLSEQKMPSGTAPKSYPKAIWRRKKARRGCQGDVGARKMRCGVEAEYRTPIFITRAWRHTETSRLSRGRHGDHLRFDPGNFYDPRRRGKGARAQGERRHCYRRTYGRRIRLEVRHRCGRDDGLPVVEAGESPGQANVDPS